ncbi:unnamed protein product, partial [Didymodactylos carnosus]
DGTPRDYYTLESIVFLLKNVELQHANYVKTAAEKGISAISRPDRKELLSYLTGQTNTADRIDRNAPIDVVAMQRPLQVKRPAEDPRLDPTKIARLEDDDFQKLKDRIEKKLEATTKEMTANQIRPLSGALSAEAILKLRAKFRATARDKIVDFKENEDQLETVAETQPVTADTFEVLQRERTWRNRTTVLQSTGKNFAKNIFLILNSIKAKEEGEQKQELLAAQRSPTRDLTVRAPVEGYSRYNQERFVPRDDTDEFKIDIHGSYHGLTLKTVTEGVQPNKLTSTTNVVPKPIPDKVDVPVSKRVSRTPIIVIPPALTSLITRYNCKELLEDLKYISTDEGKASGIKRDGDILIQRKKGNLTVPYRITDDPVRLTKQDWDERVVAVFAQGPAWQFKGWPWSGNPVEIFQKIKAYHVKWSQLKTDANIAKWSVQLIELDQNKRHLDCARLRTFWDSLDAFIAKHKPYLRY